MTNSLKTKILAHAKPTALVGLALALAIAAVFIYRYFPNGFLAGTSSYWLSETEDITQYISGFNAFFQSPFQLPLLAFHSINYPEGTRATFVDAVPAYALFLKLVIPQSFAPFNPFGVWVGLVFLMQGFCAWWIIRELKIESWSALAAMTVCLVIFPALLERIGHISLMSHWIVLSAYALYIRGNRLNKLPVLGWSILLLISFYINVYLFVMAGAIYLAAGVRCNSFLSFKDILKFFIPVFSLAISLFIMLLPLKSGAVSREEGFGFYSMNLLAPFTGGAIFNFPNAAMPGQYEGFNYLGLGIIVAFCYVCAVTKPGIKFREHKTLGTLLIALTIYSLSNVIYLGTSNILNINYPDVLGSITSQFRASGRFFWPVGYAVTIFSVVMLRKHLNAKWFLVAAVALITTQYYDTRPVRLKFQENLNRPYIPVLDSTSWKEVITPKIQNIYFYPKFRCHNLDVLKTLMPVMRFAAFNKLNLNTGYIARYQPACDDTSISKEIESSETDNSIYVFDRREYSTTQKISTILPASIQSNCTIKDFAYVCTLQRNQ